MFLAMNTEYTCACNHKSNFTNGTASLLVAHLTRQNSPIDSGEKKNIEIAQMKNLNKMLMFDDKHK